MVPFVVLECVQTSEQWGEKSVFHRSTKQISDSFPLNSMCFNMIWDNGQIHGSTSLYTCSSSRLSLTECAFISQFLDKRFWPWSAAVFTREDAFDGQKNAKPRKNFRSLYYLTIFTNELEFIRFNS